MKPQNLLTLLACTTLLGCGNNAEEVRAVTRAFWDAGKAGDGELAMSYVSQSSMARVNADDGDSAARDYTLGAIEIDGDDATVETTLSDWGEDGPTTVSFDTHLIRESGEWKIELDRTMGSMMGAVLGASVGAMAEAMGQAMQGAVKGMAEGLEEEFGR